MINFKLRLNYFDGEGGGEGANGETTGTAPAKQSKSGAYDNVVFGKQTQEVSNAVDTKPAAEVKTDVIITSNTLEEKRKAYNDLINGEYKEFYTKDTQDMINKRFKETKNLEAQVSEYTPLIEMLEQRYGVHGDSKALLKALEDDDATWADAADEAGMTVEQFKNFRRLERENAALIEEQRRTQTDQKVQAQLQAWADEEASLRAKYPEFNLTAEMQDQGFQRMLKSGVPMEQAYKVAHYDALMSDAVAAASSDAEKKVVDSVRAKGARPMENGTASTSAFTVKDDPSKFSRKDRAEIARRVARGDIITL